ncbi:MAG: N-acetylmuramoyl-L-alanine amidase family protein [Limisphaerales bacterium]
MKFFSVWVIFALGLSVSSAAFIDGQEYIPLTDWARANGFHLSIANREVVLADKTARLVFDVNSAQAQINGVNVRLSFPVAADHGIPLIAQMDINTAIHPLLYPPRSSADKRITTICLDPGHGGRDTGNRVGRGFFAHNEKAYTLPLALELRSRLEDAGFKVILTRNKDVYVDLPERPAIANRAGASLFISLHFNASQEDKDTVEGPETYCITPVGAQSSNARGENSEFGSSVGTGPTTANRWENQGLLLAYQIQKSLVQNLRATDRSVRRARFAVLRDAAMPAILIEGGYMTNPTEGQKIYSAAYREQMAAAIVKGILAYQTLMEPPRPVSIGKTNPAPATSSPPSNEHRH